MDTCAPSAFQIGRALIDIHLRSPWAMIPITVSALAWPRKAANRRAFSHRVSSAVLLDRCATYHGSFTTQNCFRLPIQDPLSGQIALQDATVLTDDQHAFGHGLNHGAVARLTRTQAFRELFNASRHEELGSRVSAAMCADGLAGNDGIAEWPGGKEGHERQARPPSLR